jgi:malonate-semialdehyde dehydrogenase (acetylating)/methylmalonate-semialdehyde dehydrogenase
MGPVISAESKTRIEGLIAKGEQDGARVLVDGRGKNRWGYEDGYFVLPTVLDDVPPDSRRRGRRSLGRCSA